MKTSPETDLLYLTHIQDCLHRITEYTEGGHEEFLVDLKTQDAVLRNLQTMAEFTQRLSASLKSTDPEIEWGKIAGFRNVLTHDYLGIALERVWLTITDDLPLFEQQVYAMLQSVNPT
jgi:uncharacterized protein with HEPN domain